MKFSWFFKTARYPFLASTITVKNVSFIAPEKKTCNGEIKIAQQEATCAGDRARFDMIMKDAAAKAFEHIRLFATKMQIPGISVAVAVNEDEPYVQCYGHSNVENLAPMEPNTKVRIGGLCSTFASILVVKNSNYDQLLTDDISNHLTLPASFRNITVQQLFDHTSGIPDVPAEVLNRVNRSGLRAGIINHVQADLATVEPGQPGIYNYSKLNGLLLSAIYVALTNDNPESSAFKTDLRELFGSFGMSNTILEKRGMRIHHKASHYKRSSDGMGVEKPNEISFKHRHGAYGVLSTASDLAIFGRTLIESTQLRRVFAHFNPGNVTSGREDEGRPRLGFHHGVGFKLLDPLPWNGVDLPEKDMLAYMDGSGVGSSSMLYLRNCYITRSPERLRKEFQTSPPRRALNGTVVSIVCNLEGVKLFELADRIAGIYEQAYKLYEDEREERRIGFF